MATYELWDERTGQTIGRWPSKSMALHFVRDLLERGEIITVAALVLRLSDWTSASTAIATGSQLVALARIGTGDEWTRRRSRDDPGGPGLHSAEQNDETASS
jgi:hypothetical protein